MIRRFLNLILFKMKNGDCKLHYTVRISRKAKVGKKCIIGRNSSVSSNVILGNNVKIGEGVNLQNICIGDNTMIESGVRIVGTGKGFINVGQECYIGVNNILDTSDSITIGNYVHIAGPSTGLWCHSSAQMCLNGIPLNHETRDKYRPTAPVRIENNVYIGGNCTIYPGISIGHHSIVTPNSAVVNSSKSYSMIGGVPAKFIKKLDE